jgi:Cohesin loading factor
MSSIQWYLQLYQAFIYCIHANWELARQSLKALEESLVTKPLPNTQQLARWTRYLHGIIEQSIGNTEAAAQIFRSPLVSTVKPSATRRLGSVYDDVAILSRLNLLLLLRSPGQAPSAEAQTILDELTTLIPSSHPNSAMRAALALLSAIINPRDPIIKKKGALQTALHMSRAINNAQLLAVTMVCMVSTFFTNIVGKQARDGKHTARALAIRAGDPLWISVAGGIAQGEDERVQAEVDVSMSRLPEQVRDRFRAQ